MYGAWAIPGSTGADDYRENIYGCNPNMITVGALLTPEPGNMTGPTSQGTQDLVGQDPNAYWDSGCNCVKGSAYAKSPRIRAVPLYNPVRYSEGQHTGRSQPEFEVVNYLGFFVEEVNGGGEVIGRITPITGRISGRTGPSGRRVCQGDHAREVAHSKAAGPPLDWFTSRSRGGSARQRIGEEPPGVRRQPRLRRRLGARLLRCAAPAGPSTPFPASDGSACHSPPIAISLSTIAKTFRAAVV